MVNGAIGGRQEGQFSYCTARAVCDLMLYLWAFAVVVSLFVKSRWLVYLTCSCFAVRGCKIGVLEYIEICSLILSIIPGRCYRTAVVLIVV